MTFNNTDQRTVCIDAQDTIKHIGTQNAFPLQIYGYGRVCTFSAHKKDIWFLKDIGFQTDQEKEGNTYMITNTHFPVYKYKYP